MPFFHWNLIKLYFNKSEVVFNLLKAFHLLVFKNFFLFYNKFISSFVYENFILFLKTNTNFIIIHHFYFLSIYIFILVFLFLFQFYVLNFMVDIFVIFIEFFKTSNFQWQIQYNTMLFNTRRKIQPSIVMENYS